MAVLEKDLFAVQNSQKGWSKERALLRRLIKEEGSKVTDVARELGKSHTTISLYINGNYSESEQFQASVRDYLISLGKWEENDEKQILDDTQQVPEGGWRTNMKDFPFIVTADTKRIWGICRVCMEQNEMGVIVGDPGLGKTFSLESYMKEFLSVDAVMVTCDETTSVKSMLIETAEALKIETKGTKPTLMRRIVSELKKNPRLLIFDEADLLKGPEPYETIRAIHDKAKTGIVLCGNNNLAIKLLMYAEDKPEMARIRDRIGYFCRLSGLTPEEAIRFLDDINATPEAKKMLTEIGRRRGIRQLVKALSRLLDVTHGDKITSELVEDLGQIVLSFNA